LHNPNFCFYFAHHSEEYFCDNGDVQIIAYGKIFAP